MSQAAALLASLSENASAYSSSEKHIVIGNDRFITVPESLKRLAVQYDHDVETVTFDCPRFWDEHDMSQMVIYINYLLPNGTTGQYKAKNVNASGQIMNFDWTISNNVTQYNGKLSFLVCIKKTDGNGHETNHWNSELNQDCYISEGLECTQTAVTKYPDIITQLLTRMDEVEEAVGDALSKISGGNNTGSGIHIGPEAPENPNTNAWLDTDEDVEAENPVPEKLPSPYPITFTGAVEDTYDGSEAVSVEIPAAVTDEHINQLINTALGVIENGTY